MLKIVCYYLPYSAKVKSALRKIQRKYKATYSIGTNEEVTIVVKEKYLPKVEKILAPLF